MEENKYICPKCDAEMKAVYNKPALNLSCPKCGCKIASSKWDDIDLDDTQYEINIKPIVCPNTSQIKLISKLTGKNYILSKSFLQVGGVVLKGLAVEIQCIKIELDSKNILYSISPNFKY